jgi:integrase
MRLKFEEKRLDHSKFRQTKEVAEWERELSSKSKLTASIRVRGLGLFCHQTGLSSSEVVKMAAGSPQTFRVLLSDYQTEAIKRGRKAAYVAKVYDTVRAWLEFRGVANERLWPAVSSVRNETLDDESAPTPEELRKLLGALGPRGRLIALLMAQSGVRPGAIGNIDGTSGLTLSSLPELNLDTLEFANVPTVLVVGSKLSKNRKSYTTFIGTEGVEAIQVALRERLSVRGAGSSLSPDEPMVASLGAGVGKKGEGSKGAGGFVTTKVLTFELRRAIRRVGFKFRPYALRSAFSSGLLVAEARRAMIRDAREAMLGHDLGAAGRYHLGKKLSPTVLEELRSLYASAYPFITTERSQTTSDEDLRRIFVTEFIGVDDADLAKLGPLTNDRIKALIAERKKDEGSSQETAAPGSQKVIAVGAVEEYISKGWRFVAPLNGTKAIVEAPQR